MTMRLDLHLPAEADSVGAARHAIHDELVDLTDGETMMNVELLASELVTNGIRHGSAGAGWIDVHLRADGRSITVEVHDKGPGFDPDAVEAPGLSSAGGWGLALVSKLADGWGIRPARTGSTVWFRVDRLQAAS